MRLGIAKQSFYNLAHGKCNYCPIDWSHNLGRGSLWRASNPEPTAAPTATAVPTDTPPPTAQRQPPKLCCICLLWPGFAQFCPPSWSSSGVRSDISAGRNPTVSITHCFSATDFSCSDADWLLLLEYCSSINALWSSVRSFKLSGGNHALFIVIKGCFIPVLAGRCRRHRRRLHE